MEVTAGALGPNEARADEEGRGNDESQALLPGGLLPVGLLLDEPEGIEAEMPEPNPIPIATSFPIATSIPNPIPIATSFPIATSIPTPIPLARRAFAEFVGTGLLVAAVVGSGIAAQRLSPGDVGLELLENAAATGAALVAIILALGPVSGAHLNPVISAIDRFLKGISTKDATAYILAQISGGAAGACLANLMFSEPAVQISTRARTGGGLWLGEVVATFGLALVVFGVVRSGHAGLAPFAVGAYIAGAYFFTSSTSFANPAVTTARMLSDTFAGIRPSSVPAFVAAQVIGTAVALGAIRFLYPGHRSTEGGTMP